MPDGTPNVTGMVNDPRFLALSPADKRAALFKVTGNDSFKSLTDGQVLQFTSLKRLPAGFTSVPLQQQQATIAAAGQPSEQIPKNYGFTPGNVVHNVAAAAKAMGQFGLDVLNPRVPLVEGNQSLLQKYVTGPMQQTAQQARQDIAAGRTVPGVAEAAASGLPLIGPLAASLGQQAGTGDIGGAATQLGVQAALGKAAGAVGEAVKIPKGAEGTMGVIKGGTPAVLERFLGRLPVSGSILAGAYGKLADSLRSTVADAITKESGVPVEPTNLMSGFDAGVKALDSQAKAGYRPVDEYLANNEKPVGKMAAQVLLEQRGNLPDMPGQYFTDPIGTLKAMRDTLTKKAQSLEDAGRGSEAHGYYLNLEQINNALDQITQRALPPELQDSYRAAQSSFKKARMLEDVKDTFGKSMGELEEGQQAPNTRLSMSKSQRAPSIGARKLISGLTKEGSRFADVFPPDVQKAIIQRADRLGVAQAVSGSGQAGIGGFLLGTGMLLQAFRGRIADVGTELSGAWLLAKVLANPQRASAYAQMLRAGSQASQLFWANQAVQNVRPPTSK